MTPSLVSPHNGMSMLVGMSTRYIMRNHNPSSILKPTPQHSLSLISPQNSKPPFLDRIGAEDCFSDEPPTSSALENKSSGTAGSPTPAAPEENVLPNSVRHDEAQSPSQPRKHRRSLSASLPLRSSRSGSISPQTSPQRSPQRSPVKEKLEFDFTPTLTGDKDGKIKITNRSKGGLSGWFNGISAPISVGLPIGEVEDNIVSPPSSIPSCYQSPDHTGARLRKKPTMALNDNTTPAKPAAASRFTFFAPKRSSTTKTFQVPSTLDDDFLSLDITAALLPSGPPKEGDPFSPSGFKELLTNAEGLLTRLQTAYKLRTLSLHELAAEKEAQKDELEGAKTRAKHLRMQLEDMAQRAAGQDEEMKKLVNELVAEKQARAREQEAREKSINLIRSHPASPCEGRPSWPTESAVGRRLLHPWQCNDETIYSEMSLESDEESSSPSSVFSRSISPITLDGSGSCSETPEIHEATVITVACSPGRPKHVQQKSTFQRVLTQITASGENPAKLESTEETGEDNELGIAEHGCRNCRGGSASVAWDTVGLLKAENRSLKEQVNRLESAVEGALDLVGGYGAHNGPR